jgi:hypothetical protein
MTAMIAAATRLGDFEVFFSEAAANAIEGKPPLEQLEILQRMVDEAAFAKSTGSGPPLDEINIVRRRYIRIASDLYRGKFVR